MYDVDNKEKHLYVIEYKELVFIVFIITFILIALFPKDILKEEILSKETDYELSMTYLKNMLHKDPNNSSLQLILAKKATQKGDLELASTLLEKLTHSPDQKVKNEAVLLNYEILKQRYFQTKDKKEQAKLKHRMYILFKQIFLRELYDDNLQKWYNEATFVNYPVARLHFIKQLIAQNPKNIQNLKDGFYLAEMFNQEKLVNRYLNFLLLYDKTEQEKWVSTKYYTLIKQKRYKAAENLLLRYKSDSPKYQMMLADVYLLEKKYHEASEIYKTFLSQTELYKERKKYFIKTLNALIGGQHYDEAVALAKHYENYFIKDKKMRTFILKTYLAANHLDDARRFSKKILQKGL